MIELTQHPPISMTMAAFVINYSIMKGEEISKNNWRKKMKIILGFILIGFE
jgi:hypothetical protein